MKEVVVHSQLRDVEGKAKVVETARVHIEADKCEQNNKSAKCEDNETADVKYSAEFEIKCRAKGKGGYEDHTGAHEQLMRLFITINERFKNLFNLFTIELNS